MAPLTSRLGQLCLLAFFVTANLRTVQAQTNDYMCAVDDVVLTYMDTPYELTTANFGPQEHLEIMNLPMVAAEPDIACEPITNDVSGMVVLIMRGECPFVDKVTHAQEAGAVAVVIYNSATGSNIGGMGASPDFTGEITIPSYFVQSHDLGVMMANSLTGDEVSVSLSCGSCDDGIQNQDEVATDIGGVCGGDVPVEPEMPGGGGSGSGSGMGNDDDDVSGEPEMCMVDDVVLNHMENTYELATATFGPQEHLEIMNMPMVAAQPARACAPITNDVSGKVVLILRGACPFAGKVMRAQEAGAIAAVIINSANGGNVESMGGSGPAANQITIPSYFINSHDLGVMIADSLTGDEVSVSLSCDSDDDDDAGSDDDDDAGSDDDDVGGGDDCLTFNMLDSWGDGWNGNTATFTACDGTVLASDVGSGFTTGSEATAEICPGTDEWTVTVGGGTWQNEVSWTLTDASGNVVMEGTVGSESNCGAPGPEPTEEPEAPSEEPTGAIVCYTHDDCPEGSTCYIPRHLFKRKVVFAQIVNQPGTCV